MLQGLVEVLGVQYLVKVQLQAIYYSAMFNSVFRERYIFCVLMNIISFPFS